MSHTCRIEARLTNTEAIRTACRTMEIEAPTEGQHRFYDGKTAEGLLVKLPGWQHPAVVKSDGEVVFDHFNGRWGKPEHLARLRQEYSAAVVEEQMSGMWAVTREQQADGTLRLHLSR